MNSLTLYAILVISGTLLGGSLATWGTKTYYKAEMATLTDAIAKGNTEAAELKAEHATKIAAATIRAEQVKHENEVLKNETATIINTLSDNVRLYQSRQQHRMATPAAANVVRGTNESRNVEEDQRTADGCVALIPRFVEVAGIAERCINTTLDNCGIAR